jgi:hypothetical protein
MDTRPFFTYFVEMILEVSTWTSPVTTSRFIFASDLEVTEQPNQCQICIAKSFKFLITQWTCLPLWRNTKLCAHNFVVRGSTNGSLAQMGHSRMESMAFSTYSNFSDEDMAQVGVTTTINDRRPVRVRLSLGSFCHGQVRDSADTYFTFVSTQCIHLEI